MRDTRLFSIGHSNHELAKLVNLLRAADVTALADVRSQPFSQRYPQFNRPELEQGLREAEIAYAFLGDLLGGRPRSTGVYDSDGRVSYAKMRELPSFQKGLQHLLTAAEEHRIALLCAEEDPLDCHRGLMIAPALAEQGMAMMHLRGDGSRESMNQMEERLLALTGVGAGMLDGLFAELLSAQERRELLREAYRRQGQRKAFRLRPDGSTLEESDEDPAPE